MPKTKVESVTAKRARVTAEGRRREIECMKDPMRWVNILCPIKRYVKSETGGTQLETAYLMGEGPIIHHGNMFAASLTTDPKEEFPSFEAIVDAGWVVD